MAVASRMKNILSARMSVTNMAQYSRVIHTMLTEMIFTLNGIALFTMKLVIYGPSLGWFISQSYSLFELRRKRAAASRSRGVVGRIGRNMPKIPSPNEISPSMASTILIC